MAVDDSDLWSRLVRLTDDLRMKQFLIELRLRGAHLVRNARGGLDLTSDDVVDSLLLQVYSPRIRDLLDDLAA